MKTPVWRFDCAVGSLFVVGADHDDQAKMMLRKALASLENGRDGAWHYLTDEPEAGGNLKRILDEMAETHP